MPRTVTLQTMIDRVRRETDQEYDAAIVSAPFVSDVFIIDALNEGIAEIWRHLVNTAPDRARVTATITVLPGVEFYTLPADFQSIRGVDYTIGGTHMVDVKPYQFEERNDFQRPWPGFYDRTGAPFRYHVWGSGVDGSETRISFRPVPTQNATVTIYYVAVPDPLSDPADTFDGIIGLESFAVAYAKDKVFSRAQDREGQALAQSDMMRHKKSTQTEAGRRDRSGHEVVADVRSRDRRYNRFSH